MSWVIAAFIFISFAITASTLVTFDGGTDDSVALTVSILTTIYLVGFTAMIITTAITTASDPTDPTVALERLARQARENNMARIDFKDEEYRFHCDLCDTHVLKNTKHCQRCNRCVYEFDHHCVWINNDIGLHNYAAFMRMLFAVFLTCVTQIGLCIYTLVFIKREVPDRDDVKVGYIVRKDLRILTIFTLAVTIVLMILVTYLLTYHIYLIKKDTTTYKHIRS